MWCSTDTWRSSDYPCLTKKAGIPFNILLLTDVQLGSYEKENSATFEVITKGIKNNPPDLLALTGDNVSGKNNDALARRLISFLDSFSVPYAMVMGNHDGQSGVSNEKLGEILASGRHSLFMPGPDNIHGTGNYAVNIRTENRQMIYSLIMMDSNGYRSADEYDYIYPEQIIWYEWMIKGAAQEAGAPTIPSMVFFHYPLPEIHELRAEMALKEPAAAANAFWEEPCTAKINTGIFDKMKKLGSTEIMFFGHDHKNLLDYAYQGIRFVYGLKTGYCAYHDAARIGTTLITINDGGPLDVKFKGDAP